MTEVKKFAGSGVIVALAAIAALAMMFSSASAFESGSIHIEDDDDNIISPGAELQVGETGYVVVDLAGADSGDPDSIVFTIDGGAGGSAVYTEAGGGQQTFICEDDDDCWDDANGFVYAEFQGTAGGQVQFRATGYDGGVQLDNDLTVTATIIGPDEVVNVDMRFNNFNGPLSWGQEISLSRPSDSGTYSTTGLDIRVTDADGDAVEGEDVDVVISAPVGPVRVNVDGAGSTSCNTDENGMCSVTVTTTDDSELGEHRISATTELGQAVGANSIDLVVAGPADSVTFEGPDEMDVASSAVVEISAADEDGWPAWTDSLTAVDSGDGSFGPTGCSRFVDGQTSCLYLSPGIAQTVIISAIVQNAVIGEHQIVVGDPEPDEPETPGFTGDIAPSGVSLVTFDGGSIDELTDAADDAGVTAVWATVGGEWVGLILGTHDWVNGDFLDAFEDGLGEDQPVVVVRP